MKKFLFGSKTANTDISLLLLRLFFGLSMAFSHGFSKLMKLGDGNIRFYDFLGIGELPSLALAVFAEFFCGLLIAAGLFSRLSAIPLMITMAVAAFMVHANDGFGKQEMPLMYLTVFFVIFLSGPGKYSLDRLRG